MKNYLWLPAALLLVSCDAQPSASAPEEAATTDQSVVAEIEAVMADSAAGWNEGDMDRFMAIYSNDPDITFIGVNGLTRGGAEVEQRYRDTYDWSGPDPSGRGVLSFETVDFRPLGTDFAHFIGRYTLTYPDEREPVSGLTSLVFAREDGNWRIVADHSN